MEVMDEIRRSYIKVLLDRGERADKRGPFEYRQVRVRKSVIDSAEGSAWVQLGETQVLAAVKFQIEKPFPDRPKEGVLSTNAELLPMANPRFEPGPPDEKGIELARIVDRAIRSAEILDLKSLYIEEDKVYGVYIDLYVLDYDGNYIDAASLAAMAALRDAKIPEYKEGMLVRDKPGAPLKLSGNVIECTFIKIGDKILLDPSLDEEHAMDMRLTIGVCGGKICAMQKNGPGAIKRAELEQMIDVAFAKAKELEANL